MTSFAERVAEQILNDAQSGSAAWDELHGPSAQLRTYPPTKFSVDNSTFTITIPVEYGEDDEPTSEVCVITVECGKPS